MNANVQVCAFVSASVPKHHSKVQVRGREEEWEGEGGLGRRGRATGAYLCITVMSDRDARASCVSPVHVLGRRKFFLMSFAYFVATGARPVQPGLHPGPRRP